ncbi:MAG: transposase family protein, partial [Desulfobacteraceae bacterium]|nr:transposase family protein [Desulfobacteraceae bacterium]
VLIQEHHDTPFAGHFGPKRTFGKMIPKYYWHGMRKDIKDYCERCIGCAQRRGQHKPHRVPMMHVPFEPYPMHTLSVDVMELAKTKQGNKYTILAYDLFTKAVYGTAIPDQKATTLARALVDFVFSQHGICKILLSDLGASLLSAVFREMCKLYGVKRLYTTAYNPKCNGGIERLHQTLQGILAITARDDLENWDLY